MSSLQVNADGWLVVVNADGSVFQDGAKSKQPQTQSLPMMLLDGTRTFLQLLQPSKKQKEKHEKGLLKQQETTTAPAQLNTGTNGDSSSSPPQEKNATTDAEGPTDASNKEQIEPHHEKEGITQREESQSHDNDTPSKEKVSPPNANPRATDPEAQELARLLRVKLYDPALLALTEIERMSVKSIVREQHGTDDSTANSKKTGQTSKRRSLSRNEIRLQQLAREQKARNNQNHEEKDNDGEASCLIASRVAMSLNSLQILLPLILSMLSHSRRKDATIVMADEKTRLQTKQHFWFGQEVYDIASVNGSAMVERQLHRILSCLFDETSVTKFCSPPYGKNLLVRHAFEQSRYSNRMEIIQSTLGRFMSPDQPDTSHVIQMAADADERILRPLFQSHARPDLDTSFQTSVETVHSELTRAIQNRFRGATLTIYGSCLSNLTLGGASDVDISLHLPAIDHLKTEFANGTLSPKEYERRLKSTVYTLSRTIQSWSGGHDFVNIEPVAHARVPVIKGRYLRASNPHSEDGSINFDICLFNEIAVANSTLLREYSRFNDDEVKELMLAVKSWATAQNIVAAQNGFLSSYAWMNLVIFYLQCIGFVPNLQSAVFMEDHGVIADPDKNIWHGVNDLNTAFVSYDEVETQQTWEPPSMAKDMPVAALLHGFFSFYASFPVGVYATSIRYGTFGLLKTVFHKSRLGRLCIEDPFETHDSHCPHDLGTVLSENGASRLSHCFQHANEHMTKCFDSSTENPLNDLKLLWELSSTSNKGEPKPGNRRRRRNKNEQKGDPAKKKSEPLSKQNQPNPADFPALPPYHRFHKNTTIQSNKTNRTHENKPKPQTNHPPPSAQSPNRTNGSQRGGRGRGRSGRGRGRRGRSGGRGKEEGGHPAED